MFKIGEFSRLSQVPIKTLRYYDQVGLLKPAHIDHFTDYRYYTADQLPRLNRILAFKDLGFSLEEIAHLLEDEISVEQLRGMLRLKQAELYQRVVEEQSRLDRVIARLQLIEQEGKMSPYEIIIKKVPSLHVAALRAIAPAYNQQQGLWQELYAAIPQQEWQRGAPCLTLYYDEEYRSADVDLEVCQPVEENVRGRGRVQVKDLPSVEQMASVVHHGPYDTLSQAYQALTQWLDAHGYHIIGPAREVYVLAGEPIRQNDPSYVTEVQFPVEKA